MGLYGHNFTLKAFLGFCLNFLDPRFNEGLLFCYIQEFISWEKILEKPLVLVPKFCVVLFVLILLRCR